MTPVAILFLIGTILFLVTICTVSCFITAHIVRARYKKWGDLSVEAARRALGAHPAAPWEKDT